MKITVTPNTESEARFYGDTTLEWDGEIGDLEELQRFVSTFMTFLSFSPKTVDSFVHCYDKH